MIAVSFVFMYCNIVDIHMCTHCNGYFVHLYNYIYYNGSINNYDYIFYKLKYSDSDMVDKYKQYIDS